MLLLWRTVGQSIVLQDESGRHIATIKVIRTQIKDGSLEVQLGIGALQDVIIIREELLGNG